MVKYTKNEIVRNIIYPRNMQQRLVYLSKLFGKCNVIYLTQANIRTYNYLQIYSYFVI